MNECLEKAKLNNFMTFKECSTAMCYISMILFVRDNDVAVYV